MDDGVVESAQLLGGGSSCVRELAEPIRALCLHNGSVPVPRKLTRTHGDRAP